MSNGRDTDVLPQSGGKYTEKRPASPNRDNCNRHLYDQGATPPGPSGDMAHDGYSKSSIKKTGNRGGGGY